MPFARSSPTEAKVPLQAVVNGKKMPSLAVRYILIVIVIINIPLMAVRLGFEFFTGKPPTNKELGIIIPVFTVITGYIAYSFVYRQLKPLVLAAKILEKASLDFDLPPLPPVKSREAAVLFDAITEAHHRYRALDNQRKDLIALLSHDLASPARAALGFIQLMEKDIDLKPELREKILTQLSQASHHQIEIIQSILALMRADSEERSPTKSLDVKSIMLEALKSVAPTAAAKSVKIQTHFIEAQFSCNAFLLTQALQNLLNNAIKFSHPGQVVWLKLAKTDEQLVISVRDEGMGFSQTVAQNLFSAKLPEGRQGTAGEKSNGIGLYLVEKVAHRHKGWVEAHSDGEGTGARFSLHLPI